MKIKEIFDSTMGILSKNDITVSESDFKERAPFIIAMFCCNTAAVDRDLRESHGFPTQKHFNEVFLDMEEDFPLDSRFSTPAAYYLAAMLIMDEKENVSDRLFDLFSNNISEVIKEIPSRKHKIINVYP